MLKTATGSSGSPIIDGSARGVLAAALTAVLNVVAKKTGLLDASDIGDLAPVVMLAAFVLGGLFDRYIRSHLT